MIYGEGGNFAFNFTHPQSRSASYKVANKCFSWGPDDRTWRFHPMPHSVSWLYAKYNNFTCDTPQSHPVYVMGESSSSCSEEAGGWKHTLKTKAVTSFEISVNFYKTTWCYTLQAMPTREVGGGGNWYKLRGHGSPERGPGPEWVARVLIFSRSRPRWGAQIMYSPEPVPAPGGPACKSVFIKRIVVCMALTRNINIVMRSSLYPRHEGT